MSSLPISNLLNQSVYVSKYISDSNEFGDEVFSTPILVKARVVYSHKLVYGTDGTSYSSVATIYFEEDIPDKSRIFVFDYNPSYQNIGNSYIYGRLDFMQMDRDIDYDYVNYWSHVSDDIIHNSKPALYVNHYYDGNGVFSHCEVSI